MVSRSCPLTFAITCVSAARYPSSGMASATFACGLVMLRYFGNRPCLVFRAHEAAFTSMRAAAVTKAVSSSSPIGTFAVRGSFPRNWRPGFSARVGVCSEALSSGTRFALLSVRGCYASPGRCGHSIMCATGCVSVATNRYLSMSGSWLALSEQAGCIAHLVCCYNASL